MTEKKKTVRAPEPKNPFVEDAVLRETVKKESMFHKDYTEFHPSIHSLRDATPDKPLVNSLCSRPLPKEGEFEETLKDTLKLKTCDLPPQKKYSFPQTTSQEIGWDISNYPQKSLFDHRHKQTDVTISPYAKWEPSTASGNPNHPPPAKRGK